MLKSNCLFRKIHRTALNVHFAPQNFVLPSEIILKLINYNQMKEKYLN